MSTDRTLYLEVAAVVAVTVLIVVLAAAASGACRNDCRAAAAADADMERALGDATLVPYAQTAVEARARQRCCVFCQSEYAKARDELVRVVPACGHFFHAACDADRWIRTSRTCPLCRSALWPSTGAIGAGVAVVVAVP